jgi:hypothetical protein
LYSRVAAATTLVRVGGWVASALHPAPTWYTNAASLKMTFTPTELEFFAE